MGADVVIVDGMLIARGVQAQRRAERCLTMARALSRVPAMRVTQLARIVGVDPKIIYQLVRKEHLWFRMKRYEPGTQAASPYRVKINSLQMYVQLSTLGKRDLLTFAEEEVCTRVGDRDIVQVFVLGDVLASLHLSGLVFDPWDVRMTRTRDEATHVILTHRASEKFYGVLLIPHVFPKGKRHWSLVGLLKRVMQYTQMKQMILLAPAEHYAATLRAALTQAVDERVYVWPLESFLTDPSSFLTALETGQDGSMATAFEAVFPEEDSYNFVRHTSGSTIPEQYHVFPALYRGEKGEYRLAATYHRGDVLRLRAYLRLPYDQGYVLPDGAGIALAYVFIHDKVIFDAVDAMLREAKSMVQAMWTDGTKEP